MRRGRYLLLSVLSCTVTLQAYNQSTYNFGIPQRQPKEQWPVTKAPAPEAERKVKIGRPALLVKESGNEYVISGGWEMTDAVSVVSKPILEPDYNTSDWLNATVPGTVLATLVDQGVYPDPYYGLNNLLIPDSLSRTDWWYRIKFNAPGNFEEHQSARLLFNGINYRADIWFNGKLLGRMTGAFKRGYFDVKSLLKEKSNVLAVHIYPPYNPGIGHEQNSEQFGPNGGALCLDGPTFIASEGWDWMPAIRDRNMGIWQDVRLCLGGSIIIGDPQVITDIPLPDTTSAMITVKVPLYNSSDTRQSFRLKGETENISFAKEITLEPGESVVAEFTPEQFPPLFLRSPRLWWPNGYGNQNLYLMKLGVWNEERELDSETIRFGIRELSYELAVDTPEKQGWRIEYSPTNVKQKGKMLFDYKKLRPADVPNKNTVIPSLCKGVEPGNFTEIEQNGNPYIVIKVNGQRIFCRGGNWGMDDAMKRVSRDDLEPAFRLHKLENFNMIRNWTGESTEEVFYDLCDEYGMLVWNDFWMSTGNYNLLPLDFDLFLENATDVVRRFRNHPSIAVWCPRNEGYAEGLETDLHSIIFREDGTRHYHGNSRELNMPGSGPWGYHDKPAEYFTRLAHGFNSELGSVAVPPYNTLKKFIAREDIWPIGDLWYYHDYHVKGWSGWDALIRDIGRLSKDSCSSAEEFCRRAEILNYAGHKIMFEAYNHRMWDNTSGVLYWMSHPAWPSLICQTYTWDFQTFGAFYGCMKSCEPTHIQWNIHDHKVIVANTSLKDYRGATASFTVYDPTGKKLFQKSGKTDVLLNRKTELWTVSVPENIKGIVIVRLVLRDAGGRILSENDYWYKDGYTNAPAGLCDFPPAVLKLTRKCLKEGKLTVTVKNGGKLAAPFVRLNVVYSDTGESVLPAYNSDNYFNLLPGETKTITIDYPSDGKKTQLKAEAVNCNVLFNIER